MKKTAALAALVLALAMLLPLLSVAGVADTEAPIIDHWSRAYSDLGLKMGEASNHGNNQTRIAYTSSGIYISCPTDDFKAHIDPYTQLSMDGANYVLYVVKPDGSTKVLIEDELFWVAAGTTTNVMVDKNEDIWVVTCWDESSKKYPVIAWHYDVSEDKVTKYDEVGYVAKGGMLGKPVSIMDAANDKIYVIVFGGQKCPANVVWTTFDIKTKTWEKTFQCTKAPCCCCYHFGYPDGNGGFYFVTTRTLDNFSAASNIEGMDVQDAMNQFQNRSSYDVGQVWDETWLYYVPNPSEPVIYGQSFGDAAYDVEKGIYPLIRNRSSDLYLDESSGLLYALREEEDCDAIGLHMMLYIYDTKGRVGEPADGNIFPLVCKKELSFGYGIGVNYFPHIVEDLEGNLYIVVATERAGEIEIWRAVDELGSEYEFVYTGGVNERYKEQQYSQWRSLISATNRNNSTPSDLGWFLYEADQGWESFSIDFAALRAKCGR